MFKNIKNLTNAGKNKQSGFFEIIVIIVIGLLLMKYFGITVSTVVAWGKEFIAWFMLFFKDILK